MSIDWRGIPLMLFAIIKKNLLRIKHSKTSLIVILFGPIALMLIVGMAFNTTSLNGIKIGIHTSGTNEKISEVVKNIKETKQFTVTEIADADECKAMVKEGQLHLCLLFETVAGKARVELHVDNTRINLVFALLNMMNARLSKESSDIGMQLSEQLISAMGETREQLEKKSSLLDDLQGELLSFKTEVNQIGGTLDNLSIAAPDDAGFGEAANATRRMQTQLAQSKQQVYTQLRTYTKRIEEAQESLSEAEDAVVAERKSREEFLKTVEKSYEDLSCTADVSKDLSPYLSDTDALVNEITSGRRPECSVLATLKEYLQESIASLQQMEENIKEMESNMDDAHDELDQFEDDSAKIFLSSDEQLNMTASTFDTADDLLEQAQEQAATLDEQKTSLTERLGSMGDAITSSGSLLTQLQDGLDSVVNTLDEASVLTPDNIINPLEVKVKPVSTEHTKLELLFPTLFTLVIMFVAILLGVIIINHEKSSRAHFRNFITPTPDILFIIGAFLTALLLTSVQVVILILLGMLVFGIQFLPVIGGLLFLVIVAGSIFSIIGIFIGSILTSEETTTLAGIIASVILFLFSSTIVPIESMTAFSRFLVSFNPFYIIDYLLRKQLIFQTNVLSSPGMLTILFIEILLLGAATIGSWALIRKRL